MITYSTNFMGPISIDWFRNRGLTHFITETVKSDVISKMKDLPIGATYEIETVHTYYAGGRIDIRGLDEEESYNGWGEYALPIMHGEDWNALSDWLWDLETTEVWDYDMLISIFEGEVLNGRKIRWADDTWCRECFMKDGVHKMSCSTGYKGRTN
jgi:hypothetical protein